MTDDTFTTPHPDTSASRNDEAETPETVPAAAPAAAHPLDAVSYLEGVLDAGGAGDTIGTGFPSVDSLLGGGVRRGDLVALGGDVGCGKTSLALGIALRVAAAGRSVAFFSGECSTSRLLERALAIEGRVRLDDLRHGQLDETQRAAVASAALTMRRSAPLLGHLPPTGVGGLADLLIEHLGLELLVVDPLQSLARGVMPMDEELAQSVRDLKALAVRRNCAVVLVGHLVHAVHGRADMRPHIGDFGALGSVRQHADVVLGLFREEQYYATPDTDGAAELHVLKQRGGGGGYADLYFYKRWLRFEDMVEPGG